MKKLLFDIVFGITFVVVLAGIVMSALLRYYFGRQNGTNSKVG